MQRQKTSGVESSIAQQLVIYAYWRPGLWKNTGEGLTVQQGGYENFDSFCMLQR